MRFGVTAATCGLAAALLSGTALARDYLPGVPMESATQPQVRDCRIAGPWPVPIITWGADEVTLHANGDQRATAAGSAFAKAGLSIALRREDDFQAQVAAYEECRSPFLRATLGMAEQAAGITEADPRTRMVAIYQHSWSAGGDVLVARADVRKPGQALLQGGETKDVGLLTANSRRMVVATLSQNACKNLLADLPRPVDGVRVQAATRWTQAPASVDDGPNGFTPLKDVDASKMCDGDKNVILRLAHPAM